MFVYERSCRRRNLQVDDESARLRMSVAVPSAGGWLRAHVCVRACQIHSDSDPDGLEVANGAHTCGDPEAAQCTTAMLVRVQMHFARSGLASGFGVLPIPTGANFTPTPRDMNVEMSFAPFLLSLGRVSRCGPASAGRQRRRK